MRRRVSLLFLAVLVGACGGQPSVVAPRVPRGSPSGAPADFDPARTGDAESSGIIAQLFETLTTFDASLELRPALAESWRVEDDGRQVVFTLRPNLTFSDGTLLRPRTSCAAGFGHRSPDPSPLVSLFADVQGATAYADGEGSTGDVGLRPDDGARTVTIDFERAAADFPAIVASPTFAVVPATIDAADALSASEGFVGSGGYRLVRRAPRRWCSRRTRGTGPGRRRSGPSRS